MLREAAQEATTPLSAVGSVLRTARVAELSSFGRIAEDRLKVINHLEKLKDDNKTREDSLQKLIQDAPWLINPEWAPITSNQTFNRLKAEFAKFFKSKTGEEIDLSDFGDSSKRPDFVLSNQAGAVQIIEIKRPGHSLENAEMVRVNTYHDLMTEFLANPANIEMSRFFPNGFHITLVCDGLSLTSVYNSALERFKGEGKLTHINWASFLARTEKVHQDFLNEAQRQRDLVTGQVR